MSPFLFKSDVAHIGSHPKDDEPISGHGMSRYVGTCARTRIADITRFNIHARQCTTLRSTGDVQESMYCGYLLTSS